MLAPDYIYQNLSPRNTGVGCLGPINKFELWANSWTSNCSPQPAFVGRHSAVGKVGTVPKEKAPNEEGD